MPDASNIFDANIRRDTSSNAPTELCSSVDSLFSSGPASSTIGPTKDFVEFEAEIKEIKRQIDAFPATGSTDHATASGAVKHFQDDLTSNGAASENNKKSGN
ncbi:uncharacterized protein IL334_003869 [Kwoniella shivajii]|uniref:Uncharacterized protein n=1 Tax=Kwoniella shivajii TaxID=564305 RepID=A0ABZ1D0L8_9TREE|nr:hypothetical protein IL334_003869 [Kwoniella shivajii]